MKRKLEKKAMQAAEEEKVCGPKIMHRVNKFLNEINQVVGYEGMNQEQKQQK